MKLSIRMKIFLPVVAILIMFPLAIWGSFSYLLESNMKYNARRDLGWGIDRVETISETSANVLEDLSEVMEAENGIYKFKNMIIRDYPLIITFE